MLRRLGLLAAAGLAALSCGPAAPVARAQSFEGCSSADVQKMSGLGRGLMSCFGLSLAEVFIFMRSMSPEQRAWLDKCSESTGQYQSECFHLLESMMQQAASQPGTLPAKVVGNVYQNPPQVTNCVGALNKNAPTFSATCSDGVMMARLTAASARMAPYINSIQPWRMPPQLDGCAVNDFLNVQLAYLPFIDCLNLNFTQFVDGMAAGGGSMGPQLEDATVRAAIDCLYDPHVSNPECTYLLILASTKLEGGSWSSVIPYAMRALTDYPQACQCVRGASASAAFQAVPQTCAARDTLQFLTALETSCSFEPQIQASLSKALRGCADADVVRAELVGVQLLDCLGAGGADLAGSSRLLDEGRIAQLANCVQDPDYANADCLALLGSLAKAAAQQPDSLEAQLVERMGQDGPGFCACVDAATKSAPAQALSPTCETPYGSLQFLRNNRDKCEMIAAVPPSFWAATASAIAAAAAKAGAIPPPPPPKPANGTTAGTKSPYEEAEVPATGGGEATGNGSWWDYLPDWNDLPQFPDMESMLSWFSDYDQEVAGNEAAARRLAATAAQAEQQQQGAQATAKATEQAHSNLRLKGNAARQSRAGPTN